MKKTFILLTIFVLFVCVLKAQNDNDIILNIQGENISKKEFLKMYNRNNTNSNTKIDKEDLKEYLDLYINYKLKLLQAEQEGLDTMPSFKDEVASYRKQMIQSYINNSSITDSLINEAYQREKEFLRASHILIRVPANATPKDTLEAYNKALMIRNRALKGEDFNALAEEYSDDPSAKDKPATEEQPAIPGNRGDLGYFTSMTMVYPFESACYALQKGEISQPVKTNFGYHIIKLTDRIPAPFFTCNIKHVWINAQNHSQDEAKQLIEEAYSHVEEWKIDSVARKYSEDQYSAQNNGWLMNQKPNTLPADYIVLLKDMKEGDLSPIIQTRYGWHFFKLMNLTAQPSLSDRKGAIAQRISKDARSYKSIENFVSQSKEYYNFKENKKVFDEIKPLVTDSIFEGVWQIPENYIGDRVVFTIGDTFVTQHDFLEELYASQRKQTPEYVPLFLDKFYRSIVDKKVLEYADSQMEKRYPEFKENMQMFREGLLIFAITDREVWTRSLIDTLGLEEFYQKNKENYVWQNRVDVTTWNIDKSIDFNKAVRIITKSNKKNKTNDETKDILLKKFFITEKPEKYFAYSWGRYEKGANKNIDKLIWNTDLSKNLNKKDAVIADTTLMTNKNNVLVLKSFLEPRIKTLDECRGIATSHYQEFLEKEWIADLRKKYSYQVYYDVFNSIE